MRLFVLFALVVAVARAEPTSSSFVLAKSNEAARVTWTAPGDGVLRIDLHAPAELGTPVVQWLDPQGRRLRGDERDLRVRAGQVVSLEIRTGSVSAERPGVNRQGSVTWRFVPDPVPGGPWPDITRARPANIGDRVGFALLERGERTCLRYAAPGDGVLRVDPLAVAPGMGDVVLRWLDAGGKELRGNERDLRVTRGQAVVLELRSGTNPWESRASDTAGTLVVGFVHDPVPGGPWPDAARARPAHVNESVRFALLERGERTCLRYESPGDGVLRVAPLVAAPGMGDVVLRWLDAGGKELRGNERDLRVTRGQAVVLELRSGTNPWESRASDTAGTLAVGFVAAPVPGGPWPDAARARPARVNESVRFALLERGERTCLRYESPGDGVLRVAPLVAAPGMGDVVLRWLDAGGKELRGNERDLRVTRGQAVVLELRSGTNPWESRASDTAGTLAVGFVAAPVPGGPWPDAARARPARVGESVRFALLERGERTCVRYETPGDGVLRVDPLVAAPGMGDVVLRWLDAGGKELRGNERDLRVTRGQAVVLELRSGTNPWESRAADGAGTFAVRFVADPVLGGPWPDRDHARTARAGEVIPFSLMTRQERVCVRFTAPATGVVEVRELSAPPELGELVLRWLEPGGAVRRDGERDCALSAGQVVILEVRSGVLPWESKTSDRVARMALDFAKTLDPQEPNDTPETAWPLLPGKPIQVTFAPRRDRDFFRVDAPGPARLALHVDGPHRPACWWRVGERVERGTELRVPGAGRVTVELRSAGPRDEEVVWREPVTVTLEMTATGDPFVNLAPGADIAHPPGDAPRRPPPVGAPAPADRLAIEE